MTDNEPDDNETEPEPLHLADLNGATLTWEGPDGEIHEVHFEDTTSDGS